MQIHIKSLFGRNYHEAIVFFFAIFLTFGEGNNTFMASSFAQGNTKYTVKPNNEVKTTISPVSYRKVSGRIVSAEHKRNGLRASVYIKALHINTVTDEKGNFSFEVPESFDESLTVVFSAAGTLAVTKVIAPNEFKVFQKIRLARKKEKILIK